MTDRPAWRRPVRLEASHDLSTFSCGQTDLDEWLAKFAETNQRAGMARVFISQADDEIAGYYALSTGGVEPAHAPSRVLRGVARHPVPVVVLTRLAVDERFQRCGLGAALIRDALLRVQAVSEEVGVRALLIHAKDQAAKDFYLAFGEFEEAPTDPMHLFLLAKDLRLALQ